MLTTLKAFVSASRFLTSNLSLLNPPLPLPRGPNLLTPTFHLNFLTSYSQGVAALCFCFCRTESSLILPQQPKPLCPACAQLCSPACKPSDLSHWIKRLDWTPRFFRFCLPFLWNSSCDKQRLKCSVKVHDNSSVEVSSHLIQFNINAPSPNRTNTGYTLQWVRRQNNGADQMCLCSPGKAPFLRTDRHTTHVPALGVNGSLTALPSDLTKVMFTGSEEMHLWFKQRRNFRSFIYWLCFKAKQNKE